MTARSPASLRVNYSTATAESVGDFLAARYALPGPVECSLLRRGFNDSFAVLDAGRMLASGTIETLDASDEPLVRAFMSARGGG